MTIKVKGRNWLADVGKVALGGYVHLSDLGGLSYRDAQAAIDATYGRGAVWLNNHGTVFWGIRREPIRQQESEQ